MWPIADLHSDLLSYLESDPNHTPHDERSRSSIEQLISGNVQLQVLPLFWPTEKGSSIRGLSQIAHYQNLQKKHKEHLFHYIEEREGKEGKVATYLAVENASCFSEEEEPLALSFTRLDQILEKQPIFYITLTWKYENRFGGGNETKIGLKQDGKTLLEYLDQKKIAIDLSHTSDALARDIITHIDKKGLNIPLIASHSNVRSVYHHERNLPLDLVEEIIQRKGLIGLNMIKKFIGSDFSHFCDHLQAILEINGEHSISFGADFFYDKLLGYDEEQNFFEEVPNASYYPYVLELVQKRLSLSNSIMEGFCYKNVKEYLQRL